MGTLVFCPLIRTSLLFVRPKVCPKWVTGDAAVLIPAVVR